MCLLVSAYLAIFFIDQLIDDAGFSFFWEASSGAADARVGGPWCWAADVCAGTYVGRLHVLATGPGWDRVVVKIPHIPLLYHILSYLMFEKIPWNGFNLMKNISFIEWHLLLLTLDISVEIRCCVMACHFPFVWNRKFYSMTEIGHEK